MSPPALGSLSQLPGFRASGTDRWFCCCPCHQENTASLRIVLANGKLLLHCFGCNSGAREIIAVMRLPWSSLWVDGKAPTKQARQALQGLYAWRERELKACIMALRGRDAILGMDWHKQSAVLGAAIVGHACEGYGALEHRFETLRTGSKDDVLELWRKRS